MNPDLISKVFNLRHVKVIELVKYGVSDFDFEFFQVGIAEKSYPRVRGSILFTCNFNFIYENIKSIKSVQVIDVLGCRLGLEKDSQNFEGFVEDSFSISDSKYESFFAVIRQQNQLLPLQSDNLKSKIANFLNFNSTLEEKMWLKVPTFIQICFQGPVKVNSRDVLIVAPNTYRTLFKNAFGNVKYYNPRGGIEMAIEKYLQYRDI